MTHEEQIKAEIERRIQRCEDCERGGYPDTTSSEATLKSLHSFIDSLPEEQPSEDLEMDSYGRIERVLSIAFMNFLDENRPKGKMCLSNGECADIDKAFSLQDWGKIARYIQKYLQLKENENEQERHRAHRKS